MELVLLPYPLSSVNAYTYSFVTENGIEYYCSFISYAEYFPTHPSVAPHIFAFNLALRDKKAKPKGVDRRIADTVIMIVGNFLEAQNNAVVYVCDNSDGREAARYRKFKSWFAYYDHPSHHIYQLTQSFEAGGMTIHSAMLIHHKNKRKMEFVDAFFALLSDEEK
jgi:hypothetical protein